MFGGEGGFINTMLTLYTININQLYLHPTKLMCPLPTCVPLLLLVPHAQPTWQPRFSTSGDALNQMDAPRGGDHVAELTLPQAKGRLLEGRLTLTWWLQDYL
jgi:hypothetical protein